MNFAAQPAPTESRAVVALVLGILGIVLCPILAPIAWAIGHASEQQIDAAAGALSGRGLATAGKITGIIGTVLLILYVLFIIVFFVFLGMAFNELDFDTTTTTESFPR